MFFERILIAPTPEPSELGLTSTTSTSDSLGAQKRSSDYHTSNNAATTAHPSSPSSTSARPLDVLTKTSQKRPILVSNESTTKRQKKLENWFRPATEQDTVDYYNRMDEEWKQNRVVVEGLEKKQINDAKIRKAALATDRKRNQRARQVVEDIKTGKRDKDGNIVKLKVSHKYFVKSDKL